MKTKMIYYKERKGKGRPKSHPKAQDNSLIEDFTMEIGGDSSPGLPKWTSQSMNKANDGIAKSLCCFHQVDKVVS